MKTVNDPRHIRRQHLVEDLFKLEFHIQKVSADAKRILDEKEILDAAIRKAAPEFPIEKINRVDLAILRLASFELLIEKKEPAHVIIDEAIELAKEYGGEKSPSFINGALSKVIQYESSKI